MTLTASGRFASTFEMKAVAHNKQTTSATAARNEGCEDLHATLVNALEASLPEVEIQVLQDVAAGLARRITGPELNLTDLTDDEEDVVPLMSPAAWDALQQIARASGVPGISSVALSPELSSGGQALVDRLKQLGVEYLDVTVPSDGDTIHFGDRRGDGPQAGGFRLGILNIRPGEPGSTLAHIYIPDGTMIKGSWEGSRNALLHFTGAQGDVLRTTRLLQSRAGEWLQLSAVDIDCIEQSYLSRDAFIDAVTQEIPEAAPRVMSHMYDKWLNRIQGPVLDLSDYVGIEAQAVLALPPAAWAAFLTDPLAAGVTTLVVSHELSANGLLLTGLHQQLNPQDPRAAFVAAAHAVLPNVSPGELFDKLLRRTRDTVLNLCDFPDDMANAVRCLPQGAWNEFLRHPQAAHLTSIVVGPNLFAAGPLVQGLSLHLYSSDERQSLDPRAAFIAHAQDVELDYPPAELSRLFDDLISCLRGKTLDLRGFVGEDAQALRHLPQEAWKALLRHHRAAALQSIKVSPELYWSGPLDPGLKLQLVPLAPGLKLRLNLRDPRAAFVAAAEHALPGRRIYKLFDWLVDCIRGDKLDFSHVNMIVNDLRCLPQSAWNAFLRHPKSADLHSIIASEALLVGGPLVDGLQMEPAPQADSST